MIAICERPVKRISLADRYLRRVLARAMAILAGAILAAERVNPDWFHSPDSHLSELLSALRSAAHANSRELAGGAT